MSFFCVHRGMNRSAEEINRPRTASFVPAPIHSPMNSEKRHSFLNKIVVKKQKIFASMF